MRTQDQVARDPEMGLSLGSTSLNGPQRRPCQDFVDVSKSAKALNDLGVVVSTGAHGQQHGIAEHWETWMMAIGGMTNHEALRAATLNGARPLGLSNDIGSLENGKLADMIVLDADPLADIKNTATVRYVMVNGRIFDAQNMAQIGNHPSPPPKPTWRD